MHTSEGHCFYFFTKSGCHKKTYYWGESAITPTFQLDFIQCCVQLAIRSLMHDCTYGCLYIESGSVTAPLVIHQTWQWSQWPSAPVSGLRKLLYWIMGCEKTSGWSDNGHTSHLLNEMLIMCDSRADRQAKQANTPTTKGPQVVLWGDELQI